jgi:hypothetical protein
MAQNVPSSIEGGTYVDENEVTQDRTWTEWAAHYGRGVIDLTTGNKGFEFSNGVKHFGSTEFASLVTAGIVPLDQPSYQALIPEPEE